MQRGHRVVIVPYRRVNEGLNLQSGIDTIVWFEMALNLFMLDQASRRAWRLGKREEVRIYYMAYANTAGHTKLRKLGQQSGAAAAFAGEPARGALIAHAGADKTTLARLSSLLEQSEGEQSDDDEEAQIVIPDEGEVAEEEAALKAVFARRAEELRQALLRGREWLGGLQDTLAERLAALAACPAAGGSVWIERPQPLVPSRASAYKGSRMEVEQPQRNDHQPEPVIALPVDTTPALPAAGAEPSPELPAGATTMTPPEVALPKPAPLQEIGSRAAVVFGRDAHIALARVGSRARRSRCYGEPLRRRVPVSEREIPSLAGGGETAPGTEEQGQRVAMPSLWDLLVAPTSGVAQASPAHAGVPSHAGHTPRQSHLWE